MNTTTDVTVNREAREAVAAKRAAVLREGLDLYADGKYVCRHPIKDSEDRSGFAIMECESHWDACLVLLAYGKEK